MTEKHRNPTNVPILKKFHRVEHVQLSFENASKSTFFLHVIKIRILFIVQSVSVEIYENRDKSRKSTKFGIHVLEGI